MAEQTTLASGNMVLNTLVDEPTELCCSITHVMFRDPVFVCESGNTYERQAITEFWASSLGVTRDALTNVALNDTALFTNWDKRREVAAWLSAHPAHLPAGWATREDVPAPSNRNPNPQQAALRRGGAGFVARSARGVVVILVVGLALGAGCGVHTLPLWDWATLKQDLPVQHLPVSSPLPLTVAQTCIARHWDEASSGLAATAEAEAREALAATAEAVARETESSEAVERGEAAESDTRFRKAAEMGERTLARWREKERGVAAEAKERETDRERERENEMESTVADIEAWERKLRLANTYPISRLRVEVEGPVMTATLPRAHVRELQVCARARVRVRLRYLC